MITGLAITALVLGVARLVVFVALHLVRSDYNIVEHAVSDYAVGRTRTLSSVMTWITAAFWGVLALATLVAFPDWKDLTGVVACLLALAAIFIVLPFLPTDVEGTHATTIGRLHMLAAIAWFALSYACMGNFGRLFQDASPQPWGTTLVALSWIALVSLIVLVAALVIRQARRYVFGIAERIFILSVTLFYITVAIAMLATS
ncbi:Protein of unknown function [Arthrobacter alpinus]|uniref:DUF998 domain-containing protein n=1 Tax=Arthrobacter alpinus TaxID=656366 RepID=A0A1H5PGR7_9MICC|nr:DUF998 domain-containing protein [Arthrobacter alpinus]SEF12318.1 Protein of unknown function [Arthrobacter alpinus]